MLLLLLLLLLLFGTLPLRVDSRKCPTKGFRYYTPESDDPDCLCQCPECDCTIPATSIPMYHDDIFCTGQNHNIEAIFPSTSNCNRSTTLTNGVAIRLLTRNTLTDQWGPTTANRIDLSSPYYLFPDNATVITTKELSVGKYVVTANPVNDPTNRFLTRFEIINCLYFVPLNQCRSCPRRINNQSPIQNTTCEGGSCVHTSPTGIRFTLMNYGFGCEDFGTTIMAPPRNTTVTAYFPYVGENFDHPKSVLTLDRITGGYVDNDRDGIGTAETSQGLFVKNIIYPKYRRGNYIVTIRSNFQQGCPQESMNRFYLYVYRKEQLQKAITGTLMGKPDGKSLVYTFPL